MNKKQWFVLIGVLSAALLFWTAGCADADSLSSACISLLCAAGACGLLLALRGIHRINYRAAHRRTRGADKAAPKSA